MEKGILEKMGEKINKKESIKEYDIIRVIAVILVVVGHCTYFGIISDYGKVNFEPNMIELSNISRIIYRSLSYFTSILYTFHMPLFFALSGALFYNSLKNNRYKNIKELVINKGKRLLIPFFIVSILYSIPIKYFTGYYSESTNLFKDIFIGQLLEQGNTHLWFLPTLFFIFVISYIYIYIYNEADYSDFKKLVMEYGFLY